MKTNTAVKIYIVVIMCAVRSNVGPPCDPNDRIPCCNGKCEDGACNCH